MSIWFGRQDIETKLQARGENKLSPASRQWLKRVLKIRGFASNALGLPRNYSFKSYSNIGRRHVVWNVVAAPEFSLNPKRFCFPVTGCINYKGYFAKANAVKEARRLKAKGYDVYVSGVSAYSTLGWFADPVLSTFVKWTEDVLSGLMFHELAHQVVYVKNDSSFNESFATTVELEGVRRWMKHRNKESLSKRYRLNKRREAQFIKMVLKYRNKLRHCYLAAGQTSLVEKRKSKQQIIAKLRAAYTKLKKEWGGYSGYDKWMSHSLNNAKLVSISTYHKYVPAFQRLLKNVDNDLPRFYREVERIGAMPKIKRDKILMRLLK